MRKARFVLMLLLLTPFACRAKELSEVIQEDIAGFSAGAKEKQPVCYPQLADRVRALFPSTGGIRVDCWSVENGRQSPSTSIHVCGSDVEIVADGDDWNLSTDDRYFYEWQKGSSSGLRIKRSNEDLVAYLCYLTDPSWIMAALYDAYLKAPKSFHVVLSPATGIEEIKFDKPVEGFEAVYASPSPLWFYGFRSRRDGSVEEFRVSKPQEEKEIPPSIKERRLKIKFQDSNETLQRHMTFL